MGTADERHIIDLKEHTGNNAGDSMEEAMKQNSVLNEKITEVFIDREHTVPVPDTKQFKRHGCGALHRVFITTRGAEAAVTSKGTKVSFPQ